MVGVGHCSPFSFVHVHGAMEAVAPGLLAATGVWYWGPKAFTLRLRADGCLDLAPMSGSGRGSLFTPTPAPDVFIGQGGYYKGERLRIARHPSGEPGHLDIATFIFTRAPYEAAAPIPGGVDPAGFGPSGG